MNAFARSRAVGRLPSAVELADGDQGYTSELPAQDAAAHGIQLEVVKLPEAKKGFVLLPRRWQIEHSLA